MKHWLVESVFPIIIIVGVWQKIQTWKLLRLTWEGPGTNMKMLQRAIKFWEILLKGVAPLVKSGIKHQTVYLADRTEIFKDHWQFLINFIIPHLHSTLSIILYHMFKGTLYVK